MVVHKMGEFVHKISSPHVLHDKPNKIVTSVPTRL